MGGEFSLYLYTGVNGMYIIITYKILKYTDDKLEKEKRESIDFFQGRLKRISLVVGKQWVILLCVSYDQIILYIG